MICRFERYPEMGFDLAVNVGPLCIDLWWDPTKPWRNPTMWRRFEVRAYRKPTFDR